MANPDSRLIPYQYFATADSSGGGSIIHSEPLNQPERQKIFDDSIVRECMQVGNDERTLLISHYFVKHPGQSAGSQVYWGLLEMMGVTKESSSEKKRAAQMLIGTEKLILMYCRKLPKSIFDLASNNEGVQTFGLKSKKQKIMSLFSKLMLRHSFEKLSDSMSLNELLGDNPTSSTLNNSPAHRWLFYGILREKLLITSVTPPTPYPDKERAVDEVANALEVNNDVIHRHAQRAAEKNIVGYDPREGKTSQGGFRLTHIAPETPVQLPKDMKTKIGNGLLLHGSFRALRILGERKYPGERHHFDDIYTILCMIYPIFSKNDTLYMKDLEYKIGTIFRFWRSLGHVMGTGRSEIFITEENDYHLITDFLETTDAFQYQDSDLIDSAYTFGRRLDKEPALFINLWKKGQRASSYFISNRSIESDPTEKVITTLQEHGNMSTRTLARALQKPVASVYKIIKSCEESGRITSIKQKGVIHWYPVEDGQISVRNTVHEDTPYGVNLLKIISQNTGISTPELSELMRISIPQANQALHQLEDSGRIVFTRSDDNFGWMLSETEMQRQNQSETTVTQALEKRLSDIEQIQEEGGVIYTTERPDGKLVTTLLIGNPVDHIQRTPPGMVDAWLVRGRFPISGFFYRNPWEECIFLFPHALRRHQKLSYQDRTKAQEDAYIYLERLKTILVNYFDIAIKNGIFEETKERIRKVERFIIDAKHDEEQFTRRHTQRRQRYENEEDDYEDDYEN